MPLSSEDVQREWFALARQLEQLNEKLSTAGSPQQFQAILGQMTVVSNKTREVGMELSNGALQSDFKKIYASEGGVGAVDKYFTDRAYKNRKKVEDSVRRMALGANAWSKKAGEQQAALKAADALAAQNLKLRELVRNRNISRKQKEELLENIRANAMKIEDLRKKGGGIQIKNFGGKPSIPYYARKNTTHHSKGSVYAMQPLDRHMALAHRTAMAANANIATAAAAAKGSGYVIVHDGPDCGKNGHGLGPAVNGQVWTAREAAVSPLGHPNCQRWFEIAAGPPGSKKLKQQLGQRTKAEEAKDKLEIAAEVAASLGIAMHVGSTVVRNPFVQRFMLEILNDTAANLGPTTQAFLTKLTSKYGRLEDRVIQQFGDKLGVGTPEALQAKIANEFEEKYATREFLDAPGTEIIELEAHQAQTLGLKVKTTKREFLEAYDEYNDYRLFKKPQTQTIDNILEEQAMFRDAKDDLYGSAAIRYHLAPGEGWANHRHWGVVVRNLKKAYETSPEKANIELIRLTASLIDPLPWAKAGIGNFRFSIGMPSRARQDLAEKLYSNLKKNRHFSDQEYIWAEQLGIRLPKEPLPWEKADIIRVLTPRITFDTGKLFSATIGLENGKLKPIIKARPPGIFNRFLDIEKRLGEQSIQDFIDGYRRGVPIKDLLKEMNEDSITAVNFFRHGPLQASVRWHGLDYDSFTIKILPENDYLRYSKRFMKGDEIIDRWREGIEVMPHLINSLTGLRWQPWSWAGQKAIASLRYAGYSVAEIAKRLRLDFQWTLEWLAGNKEKLDELFRVVATNIKGLNRGVTWREVKAEISKEWDAISRREVSRLRGNITTKTPAEYAGALDEVRDRIDPKLLENKLIHDDLTELAGWWRDNRPNQDFPRIKIVPDENIPAAMRGAPMFANKGGIFIPQSSVDNYELLIKFRRKSVANGFLPRGTERSSASFFHEATHYITDSMSDREYRTLLINILESQDWPISSPSGKVLVPKLNLFDRTTKSGNVKDITRKQMKDAFEKWMNHPTINSMIRKQVGVWAAQGPDELISELMSQYIVGRDPSNLAQTIGRSIMRSGTLRTAPGGIGTVTTGAPKAIKFSVETVKFQELVRGKVLAVANKWKTTAQNILEVWKNNAADYLRLLKNKFSGKTFAQELEDDALAEALRILKAEDQAFLTKYVDRPKATFSPDLGYAPHKTGKELLRGIDDRLLDDPYFARDLERYTDWWRQTFPGVRPPKIVLSVKGDQWDTTSGILWQQGDTIVIPENTFRNYGKYRQKFIHGADTGWFVEGAGNPLAGLQHETGHYLLRAFEENPDAAKRLVVEIFGDRTLDFPGIDEAAEQALFTADWRDVAEGTDWRTLTDVEAWEWLNVIDVWMEQSEIMELIQTYVSDYALTDHHELVAELTAQLFNAEQPTEMAFRVFEMLMEFNKNS